MKNKINKKDTKAIVFRSINIEEIIRAVTLTNKEYCEIRIKECAMSGEYTTMMTYLCALLIHYARS